MARFEKAMNVALELTSEVFAMDGFEIAAERPFVRFCAPGQLWGEGGEIDPPDNAW